MKTPLILLFLLLPILALAQPLEPYRHNFFTTNPAPVVDVVAGSNTVVTPSLIGTSTRRFTVSATATPAQTNFSYSAITNAPWQWGTQNLTNWSQLDTNSLAALTNGYPWTNLTVALAGAVTNGYPWTNIYSPGVSGGSTNQVYTQTGWSGYPQVTNLSLITNGIGTTVVPSLWLTNPTPASLGAQQNSPVLMQAGQGWRSGNSTTMPVAMGWGVVPVQGSSANPTAQYTLFKSISNAVPTSTTTYFTDVGSLVGTALTTPMIFETGSGWQFPGYAVSVHGKIGTDDAVYAGTRFGLYSGPNPQAFINSPQLNSIEVLDSGLGHSSTIYASNGVFRGTLTATNGLTSYSSNNVVDVENLGTTVTPALWLTNGTAAALGAQQNSPVFMQAGQGWRSGNSTTMPVAMGWGVVPIQGSSANPTANYLLYSSISNTFANTGIGFSTDGLIFTTNSATGYWASIGNDATFKGYFPSTQARAVLDAQNSRLTLGTLGSADGVNIYATGSPGALNFKRSDGGIEYGYWSGSGLRVGSIVAPAERLDVGGNAIIRTNLYVGGTLTATNGISVPTFFNSPTNTPTDAYVLTATSTGGATAWKASSGNATSTTNVVQGGSVTTSNGVFTGDLYANLDGGRCYLRSWDAALAQIATSNAIIAYIGDSWTIGQTFTSPLDAYLKGQYGFGGCGFVAADTARSPAWPIGGIAANGIVRTNRGTWSYDTYSTGLGASICDAYSTDTATPATISVTGLCTSVSIHYIQQTNGGTFTARVDGAGTTYTVDTSGWGTNLVTTNITGLAANTLHGIVLTVTVAGSAGVKISGLDLRSSLAGVVSHNIGCSGSQASHWAATDNTAWTNALAALNPNLYIITLGVNEEGANVAPTTYSANLQTIISRIRALNTNASIVINSPSDITNDVAYTYPMSAYVTEMEQVAATNQCGFVNNYKQIGPFAAAALMGLYANMTHPSVAGGKLIGYHLMQYLLQGFSINPNTLAQSGQDVAATSMGVGNGAGIGAKTGGLRDISFGPSAGAALNGGADNTFIGYQSGFRVTDGGNNVAIGNTALAAATTSSGSVAIGSGAAAACVDGSATAIGYQALKQNSTGVGSRFSTAIGYQALYTGTTGNGRSVAVGFSAGKYETGGTNLFIGVWDQTSAAADEQYSLLYGKFATGAGTRNGAQLTVNGDLYVAGAISGTNGYVHQIYATNGYTVCTQSKDVYLVNSATNPIFVLPDASTVAGREFLFSSTNYGTFFIVTNATGTQPIANGQYLSYTNQDNGIKVVKFISDGAAWWLSSKGRVTLPSASWSCNTNITFPNVTNMVTLDTQEANNGVGIALDNSAWFTPGIGSRIWVTNAGMYLLTFSALWSKVGGGAANGDVWLRQDGAMLPRTMTLQTIQNATTTNVMTVNFILPVTKTTYFDLVGASPDGTAQMQAMPAITTPFARPAAPSMIVTIQKTSD